MPIISQLLAYSDTCSVNSAIYTEPIFRCIQVPLTCVSIWRQTFATSHVSMAFKAQCVSPTQWSRHAYLRENRCKQAFFPEVLPQLRAALLPHVWLVITLAAQWCCKDRKADRGCQILESPRSPRFLPTHRAPLSFTDRVVWGSAPQPCSLLLFLQCFRVIWHKLLCGYWWSIHLMGKNLVQVSYGHLVSWAEIFQRGRSYAEGSSFQEKNYTLQSALIGFSMCTSHLYLSIH